MTDVDDAVVLVTLTEFNDRWNKIALGISDTDVPSRPADSESPREVVVQPRTSSRESSAAQTARQRR